jgi:hypothetical protein
MTNYTVTTGLTTATLETAIEALETTASFEVIPYRVGCTPMFVLVTPASATPS